MTTNKMARSSAMTIPAVTVNRVSLDAPWQWLSAGWRDFLAAPHIGLVIGGVLAAVAAALTAGLFAYGLEALILPFCGGFLLVGPITAVALYETSRRLERNGSVELMEALACVRRAPNQILFFGAVLAFVYLIWLLLAFLLFMLFFGATGAPTARDLVPTLLFTSHGLGLLVAGTSIGAMLAAMIFAISVVSVPLLMLQPVDAVTAMGVSLSVVAYNPKPMLLWATLLAGMFAFGLATLFIGLIVVFPLVGFATWHAFRDLVRESPTDYL
jgi:uncharacterized membrane protein